MDIKEEYILPDDVDSQNEGEFFTMETNSDDGTIKTEIKSETPSTNHVVKQSTFETVMCSSNNWKTEIGEQALVSDFGSQNKGEFLPENPVMKDKKYNVDHEMDNKIEVKQEPRHLETETAIICDDIKDRDFSPVGCSSLCLETFSGNRNGKSPLSSAEVSGTDTTFYNGYEHLECEHIKLEVTESPTAEEHVLSEHSGKCNEGEKHINPLYFKQQSLIPKDESPHQCKTCNKGFIHLSRLKRHNLIHEGKEPYQCKTCDKRFTHLSSLKRHNLIHEGKKAHQCKTCDKRFTHLSSLKTHNLIHEGKKPHQCKTCNKSFTQSSTLKIHNLTHQDKKQYQCKTCNKRFTHSSTLYKHNFIHEDKKPHQCKTCDKGFNDLSTLKRHNLIHEDKKPHQCKTCDKRFTDLSTMRTHNLIHEGKKPHQCKTCDKRFTALSNLKRHSLIHEHKKPHQCKTCDKRFTDLSNLKRHNLTHEANKIPM